LRTQRIGGSLAARRALVKRSLGRRSSASRLSVDTGPGRQSFNTTASSYTAKQLVITPSFTPPVPGCETSWFVTRGNEGKITPIAELLAGTRTVTVPVGKSQVFTDVGGGDSAFLRFNDSGTDQSACSGAELSLKAVLVH
jgi:hypothetical protein